jgi:hypothetical protein
MTAMPAAWRASGTRKSGVEKRPIEVPSTTKRMLNPATNRSACGSTWLRVAVVLPPDVAASPRKAR